MSNTSNRLEFWKQIAQIASALAVPLVLAFIGYLVQSSLADAGLKKDYVQMALGVLKDQPTKENEQLRQWAISVLDKNSPVPIPSALKSQLLTSKKLGWAFGLEECCLLGSSSSAEYSKIPKVFRRVGASPPRSE